MDKYSDLPTTLTAPARDAASVVPNDSTDLAVLPRAVFVGATGNLTIRMAGGQSVTFKGVSAGTLLPIRAQRIMATGTTAADLLALW